MIMMMKWLYTYSPTINNQTSLNKPIRKQKLFKKLVAPEVSKLNHAVINKKQRDKMQFFSRKKYYKKRNEIIQPIIPADRLCYKIGCSIHQISYKFVLIVSKR